MATIISKNFYLTNTQMDDNSGLIGYQNLVTPSTITATSQLSSDPITSAANPATAWGWVAGDQPAPADAIEYTGTNYTDNPFDPSAWVAGFGDITTITGVNPSGAPYYGLFEITTNTGFARFSQSTPRFNGLAGETIHACALLKQASSGPVSTYWRVNTPAGGYLSGFVRNITAGDGDNYTYTDLSDGWVLACYSFTLASDEDDIGCDFIVRDADGATGTIGTDVYVQAVYFGKSEQNPATIIKQGVVPDQTVTINTGGQLVDYIGIAKHNLNQIGLTVAIKYNGITVVPAQPVSEKQALLFLNNIASPDTVELIISGATSPPRIAVLYVGKALRLQRNIYVGHTPISYGRNRTAINGVSENGQYLGELVVREVHNTSVNLQNLTPDWYRQNLDPFFALSPRVPCFWAWRPSKYEDEVGYCWIEGDPQMSNQRSNGMVQCSWNFKGIV